MNPMQIPAPAPPPDGKANAISPARGSVVGALGGPWATLALGALRIRLRDPERREEAEWVLAGTLGVPLRGESDPTALTARVSDPERAAAALAQLARAGIAVREFSFAQPGLTALPRPRNEPAPTAGDGGTP
jgi:hypothetical protein